MTQILLDIITLAQSRLFFFFLIGRTIKAKRSGGPRPVRFTHAVTQHAAEGNQLSIQSPPRRPPVQGRQWETPAGTRMCSRTGPHAGRSSHQSRSGGNEAFGFQSAPVVHRARNEMLFKADLHEDPLVFTIVSPHQLSRVHACCTSAVV